LAQQRGEGPRDPGYAAPIDITPIPYDDGQLAGPHGLGAAAGPGDALASHQTPGDGTDPRQGSSRRGSSRTRRIVLGSVLAVGLAGAAVLGTAGVRILQQKDATLTPPDAVAGLTRDRSEGATATADNLRTALSAGIDLDHTVAVVYADPADRARSAFFFGGTTLLFSPERELDSVLELLGEQGDGATGMRDVTPGRLDGVMKCGTVRVPEGAMSACGWADHGSVAVAMFPERTVEDAAALMRTLREATETRS
jgi:hypothetical protein